MFELLKVAQPQLLEEWDAERNATVPLGTLRVNASNLVWWKCRVDARHVWKTRVRNRAMDGNGCPYCSGRKTLREESFAALHSDIACQLHPTRNPGLDPFAVSPGSNKLVRWICDKGHEWRSTIVSRVQTKSGCRKCAYVRNISTLADSPLAEEFHPTKNGKLTADQIGQGSRRRVWWRCTTDPAHEWQETVSYRIRTQNRCPECFSRTAGHKPTLAEASEQLSLEWHPTLNNGLTPSDVTTGSSRKVWWQCSNEPSHVWQATVRNRAHGKQGCPKCAPRHFDERNTIARKFSQFAAEWHPTKNGILTPSNVTVGSSRRIWWRCAKDPTHEWSAVVSDRTRNNRGCPKCSGYSVVPARSLAALFPKIAAEWHPTKNTPLNPSVVAAKSAKWVWWQCSVNPAHEWKTRVKNRTIAGSGCHHCAQEHNALKIAAELAKSAFNTTDVFRTFLFSIRSLERLSSLPPSNIPLRPVFFRMLYAQVITTLEAYLSDSFLHVVLRDPALKKRLFTDVYDFRERRFSLAEIVEQNPTSDEGIASIVSEISWHNIGKAKALFSTVCGVDFSNDLSGLFKAVINRHDIVHRNGRSIKGRVVNIGERELAELIVTVKAFVRALDQKLTKFEQPKRT